MSQLMYSHDVCLSKYVYPDMLIYLIRLEIAGWWIELGIWRNNVIDRRNGDGTRLLRHRVIKNTLHAWILELNTHYFEHTRSIRGNPGVQALRFTLLVKSGYIQDKQHARACTESNYSNKSVVNFFCPILDCAHGI